MRRSAFTLLELIFVIVILGILSKYGIELLSQAYKNFIFSNINNALQSQSAAAVETVAARLQHRIKDSVIARESGGAFSALAGYTAATAPILEWVGADIDGFRGNAGVLPHYSGVIDIGLSNATTLVSPETNTSALNSLISTLSNGVSGIDDAAIYFVGSDSDINNYGWDGTPLADHNTSVMHPIKQGTNVNEFESGIALDDFSGVNVYEYYQLAWTAYAVGIQDYNDTTKTGTLRLWYDYQPWNGDSYINAKNEILMENVSTFRFKAIGSIIKIQVCVNSDLMENYSLCKEKTVF